MTACTNGTLAATPPVGELSAEIISSRVVTRLPLVSNSMKRATITDSNAEPTAGVNRPADVAYNAAPTLSEALSGSKPVPSVSSTASRVTAYRPGLSQRVTLPDPVAV